MKVLLETLQLTKLILYLKSTAVLGHSGKKEFVFKSVL